MLILHNELKQYILKFWTKIKFCIRLHHYKFEFYFNNCRNVLKNDRESIILCYEKNVKIFTNIYEREVVSDGSSSKV
jgi:hypothetical protein